MTTMSPVPEPINKLGGPRVRTGPPGPASCSRRPYDNKTAVGGADYKGFASQKSRGYSRQRRVSGPSTDFRYPS